VQAEVDGRFVWTGSIIWLLSHSIRLYPAARSERINLHQIHKKCHTDCASRCIADMQ